MDIGFIN